MNRINLGIDVASLLALGILFLYGLGTGDSYNYWTVALGIVVMCVPIIFEVLGLSVLPWPVLLSVSTALLLHSGGRAAYLYETFPWWDNLTHLVSGVVVALLVTMAMLIVIERSTNIRIPARWVPFFIFVSVIAFEGMWEMIEFSIDQATGTMMQHSIEDTISDITTCMISGIVAGLGSAFYIHMASIKGPISGFDTGRLYDVLMRNTDER
jgi:hypothetical protein